MEHYRSTLATAAVAAFGLVAAAHILHPGNYEDRPRNVRAPIVRAEVPASTMAWVDPPARASAVSAVSNAAITTAAVAEAPAAHRETQAANASVEQLRKPVAPRRRRLAQRRTRVHQAALTRGATSPSALEGQASAPAASARPADRFDPIGTLIHGLGLDS